MKRFQSRSLRPYGASRHRALSAALSLILAAGGAAVATAKPIRLLAFGDSLTAGYGLPPGEGFAPRLEAALRKQGHDVTVVDGGVSGDTTTGGLARLDWTLGDGADAVILELGANDMLRGIDPKVPDANLDKMLATFKARHIPVLLAGMHTTPSMGRDYSDAFDAIYPTLARKYGVALYPFFLDGIIGDASLHLADGLHPNAAGVDVIVEKILPSVDDLLKQVGQGH